MSSEFHTKYTTLVKQYQAHCYAGERIVPELDNCSNQDRKDAYTYLYLKVKEIPEGADIKGYNMIHTLLSILMGHV